jgi:hypothetical protein
MKILQTYTFSKDKRFGILPKVLKQFLYLTPKGAVTWGLALEWFEVRGLSYPGTSQTPN